MIIMQGSIMVCGRDIPEVISPLGRMPGKKRWIRGMCTDSWTEYLGHSWMAAGVSNIWGDGQTEEFALDGLEVTIRNAPFAPSDPSGTQRFEAEGIIRMEAPVRFLGKMLLPLEMELKVQAGYTEVF